MRGKGSALRRPFLDSLQRGTQAYTYKGLPCRKNPFDLALYQMLIGELRPRTIVEIGSYRGGSAVWFADMMRTMALPANVHSVDVNEVDLDAPGVMFHRGDASALEAVLRPELMRTLPRPWLVVEDTGHAADTTLAVLGFFYNWLDAGEYIITGGGIVREHGVADDSGGSPTSAVGRFQASHPDEFEIDGRYCDWFGDNATYNVDGYLRRKSPRPSVVRAHPDSRRAANLERVNQRSWFYEFDLPDGRKTTAWPRQDVLPIHFSRIKKLREVIAEYVEDPRRLFAIDLAAHEGYFTFELARHFARVDAYELRAENIAAARLMADVLDVSNVTFTQIDFSDMVFEPSLVADFVLVYGLLYHVEDPIRLLRLASQLTRQHILIETQVFPYDMTGRIEDGHFQNLRNVEGVFSLSPDYPQASVGGTTNLALIPSVNSLMCILRSLGFTYVEALEFDADDYEQFFRGSRIIIYGDKR